MTEQELRDNICTVREKIAAAAVSAGRKPQDIRLLAVSKTVGIDRITQAHDAGLCEFAENYIQELTGKLEALPRFTWHMIGHLQSNKYKYISGENILIHTLDSLSLAGQIQRQREGKNPQQVLIQVNIGREEQKSGIEPEELFSFAEKILSFSAIALEGLMCIAPAGQPADRFYDSLRMMADACAQRFGAEHFRELSMGMSGDFETAIGYGATMVRVGSALFGKRM